MNRNNQYLKGWYKRNAKTLETPRPNILARVWDEAIGIFSPASAYRNVKIRKALSRGYAGAKQTPSLKEYWNASSDPNADIRVDRRKVADRVRQLVRDMPWMDGALESTADYMVGEGMNFKPAIVGKDGLMDRETNKAVKDAFLRWCEKASSDNKNHFGDLQRLTCRQMIECGEAIFIHRIDGNGYRLLPLEPDCIDDGFDTSTGNIDQGIQFNPKTNEFEKYFFVNGMSTLEESNSHFSIPARDVIHLYKQKRPWQRRGISPLVQTILIAGDLDEFLSGEMASQQMASRWLAFITDPNAGETGENEPYNTTIDNLTIETLPPGKQVSLAPGAERPTLGLETFQRIFLQVLSVILRIPYSVISSDFKQLNYNTLREIRNNTVHRLKPEWAYLTRHFLNPVFRRWMDYSVLSGDLNLKNYYQPGGKEHYQKCFWMPPGIESVDVLRDIKGVVLASANGMYDPQDWIMSQGEDPEEVMAGLKEYQEMLKKYGIETNPTASDSNLRSNEEEKEDE